MKLHLTGLLLLTLCLSGPIITVDAQERATFLKGPKDATDQYSGLEYGPIDANDTLWRIAERYRQNNNPNPNCSTIQMLVALKPIQDAVGIDRINVCTYQSVSGAGKEAMEELAKQTAGLLNAREVKPESFSRQIAFNVIPQIDVFQDNDYTKEEMKMLWETQKIMGDQSILVNATAVRVPVFYGHAEAIHLETRSPIDAQHVKELLADAPGVTVYDGNEQFPTQVSSASGNDIVHVGRIRNDITHPCGLNLWVVSDNIRKGAATNSIQIAETLIRDYL